MSSIGERQGVSDNSDLDNQLIISSMGTDSYFYHDASHGQSRPERQQASVVRTNCMDS